VLAGVRREGSTVDKKKKAGFLQPGLLGVFEQIVLLP
jgi:hypothetical protein